MDVLSELRISIDLFEQAADDDAISGEFILAQLTWLRRVEKELTYYKEVEKAANWLLHLHHGVGKSGEAPNEDEWEACLGQLKEALKDTNITYSTNQATTLLHYWRHKMTDRIDEIRKDIERMNSTHGTLEFVSLTAGNELLAHIDQQDKMLAEGAEIINDFQEHGENYNSSTKADDWLKAVAVGDNKPTNKMTTRELNLKINKENNDG
ncbi:hypothetical protein KAR91_27470 [Candidatus Pacearchaeota archaeon]|nr:hypothetical protein [Candidatus Pacearchaeota archaeon]